MSMLDELFESREHRDWRHAMVHVLNEFLDVFKDIANTQKDRLAVEKEILGELKRLSHNPPVKFIVQFGTPVSQ